MQVMMIEVGGAEFEVRPFIKEVETRSGQESELRHAFYAAATNVVVHRVAYDFTVRAEFRPQLNLWVLEHQFSKRSNSLRYELTDGAWRFIREKLVPTIGAKLDAERGVWAQAEADRLARRITAKEAEIAAALELVEKLKLELQALLGG